ncbi:hypothetical protein niasHT_026170 [Heterodera trifolii]|uniref:F-box domain-containing protein n=1 Tax=Heterodera trifolii TaxID=157864 RepID=A0ABD2K297_9BILA
MPKRVPFELVLEIVGWVPFHKKWTRINVCRRFDRPLMKRMAQWLINVEKVIDICRAAREQIMKTIERYPPKSHKSLLELLYGRLVLRTKIDHLQLPTFPELAELGLNSEENNYVSVLKWHCLNLVELCCNSVSTSTEHGVKNIRECMLACNGGLSPFVTNYSE